MSTTTTYRYFKKLTKAGLISPVAGAGYTLGPAIIQMDRLIQSSDPMLSGARAVMIDLVRQAAEGSTVLLCRLFHDRVMCVHQIMGRGPQEPVSYERGRLMPLYRGATSKIILGHLPPRTLKALFAHDAAEIAAAGLGASWEEFRRGLAAIRRAGVSASAAARSMPAASASPRPSSTRIAPCWAASAWLCRPSMPTTRWWNGWRP